MNGAKRRSDGLSPANVARLCHSCWAGLSQSECGDGQRADACGLAVTSRGTATVFAAGAPTRSCVVVATS